MFLSAIVMMKNRRSSEWELCWGAWGGGGSCLWSISVLWRNRGNRWGQGLREKKETWPHL